MFSFQSVNWNSPLLLRACGVHLLALLSFSRMQLQEKNCSISIVSMLKAEAFYHVGIYQINEHRFLIHLAQ
jgi:hypothetical protein